MTESKPKNINNLTIKDIQNTEQYFPHDKKFYIGKGNYTLPNLASNSSNQDAKTAFITTILNSSQSSSATQANSKELNVYSFRKQNRGNIRESSNEQQHRVPGYYSEQNNQKAQQILPPIFQLDSSRYEKMDNLQFNPLQITQEQLNLEGSQEDHILERNYNKDLNRISSKSSIKPVIQNWNNPDKTNTLNENISKKSKEIAQMATIPEIPYISDEVQTNSNQPKNSLKVWNEENSSSSASFHFNINQENQENENISSRNLKEEHSKNEHEFLMEQLNPNKNRNAVHSYRFNKGGESNNGSSKKDQINQITQTGQENMLNQKYEGSPEQKLRAITSKQVIVQGSRSPCKYTPKKFQFIPGRQTSPSSKFYYNNTSNSIYSSGQLKHESISNQLPKNNENNLNRVNYHLSLSEKTSQAFEKQKGKSPNPQKNSSERQSDSSPQLNSSRRYLKLSKESPSEQRNVQNISNNSTFPMKNLNSSLVQISNSNSTGDLLLTQPVNKINSSKSLLERVVECPSITNILQRQYHEEQLPLMPRLNKTLGNSSSPSEQDISKQFNSSQRSLINQRESSSSPSSYFQNKITQNSQVSQKNYGQSTIRHKSEHQNDTTTSITNHINKNEKNQSVSDEYNIRKIVFDKNGKINRNGEDQSADPEIIKALQSRVLTINQKAEEGDELRVYLRQLEQQQHNGDSKSLNENSQRTNFSETLNATASNNFKGHMTEVKNILDQLRGGDQSLSVPKELPQKQKRVSKHSISARTFNSISVDNQQKRNQRQYLRDLERFDSQLEKNDEIFVKELFYKIQEFLDQVSSIKRASSLIQQIRGFNDLIKQILFFDDEIRSDFSYQVLGKQILSVMHFRNMKKDSDEKASKIRRMGVKPQLTQDYLKELQFFYKNLSDYLQERDFNHKLAMQSRYLQEYQQIHDILYKHILETNESKQSMKVKCFNELMIGQESGVPSFAMKNLPLENIKDLEKKCGKFELISQYVREKDAQINNLCKVYTNI